MGSQSKSEAIVKLLIFSFALLALGVGCADERESTGPVAGTSLTRVVPAEPTAPVEDGTGQESSPLGDFPAYPGSESDAVPGGEGASISLTTPDTPKQVFEFYRRRLQEEGWSIDEEHREGALQSLTASKGARLALVDLTGKGSTTEIEILLLGK